MTPEELFNEVNEMWDEVHKKLQEMRPLTPYQISFNRPTELYRNLEKPINFKVQKLGGKWTICVDTYSGIKPVEELGFDNRCKLLEFTPQVINEVVRVNETFFNNMKKEIEQARQFHKQFLASCQLMDKPNEI